MPELTNEGSVRFSDAAVPGAIRLDLVNPSGTFTPSLVTTGDPMTISYTNRGGRWARVGPVVYVTGSIVVASVSGGTGNLRIGNLPFTTANSQDHRAVVSFGIWNANSWPANTSNLLALAMAGEARLGLYAVGPTTGILNFTPADIKAGTSIRFGGFYFTDDPLPS